MPQILSPDAHVEQGEFYYRKKKYELALQSFNKARHAYGDNIPMILLNHRAATLEKLGHLDLASREALNMINLYPTDASGYLRRGRIHEKSDKDSGLRKAFEIYSIGLLTVPLDHEHYKLLHAKQNKLKRQLFPQDTDPISVLPVELNIMIFDYLSFSEIVSCLRVSKKWANYLTAEPRYWRDLDLSNARKTVPYKSIAKYRAYSQNKITRATLYRHSDSRTLSWLALRSPLQSLDFRADSYGPNSIISALQTSFQNSASLTFLHVGQSMTLSLATAVDALAACPSLNSAWFDRIHRNRNAVINWPNLPNLRDVRFNAIENVQHGQNAGYSPQLSKLLQRAPNLETFVYEEPKFRFHWESHSLDSVQHLQRFFVRGDVQPCSFPRSLKHIKLQSTSVYRNRAAPIVSNLLQLPLLETLEASGAAAGTTHKLLASAPLGSTTPPLRRLVLNYIDCPLPHGIAITLKDILKQCPNIEELGLESSELTDEIAETIPDILPRLRRIGLAWTQITGVTIKALVQKLPKGQLEFLDVSYCQSLSPDAVDWAKAQGVRVKYSMAEGFSGNGRRVQYGYTVSTHR
ncbi:hypothetical protein NA57DRAFT_55047 [Rhizodiscina lignyota]|uniref:F-box domain-containing protein n=1 Tax=Rhizodiscina lignyota TaxID=1504668 RepID=A0A9P4M7R6_9PEZI|nr:hypothetical protein NA57DRAFT_55047 [Rhizodiscina lignyota]